MKFLPLVIFPFMLCACASLLPKGPPAANLYTLNAGGTSPLSVDKAQLHLPVSLQILMPQAASGLETEQIALRKGNNEIDYYTNAKWAAPVTALVQSLLVEAFDKTQTLKSVSNDLVALNKDYSLLIEIRDFQVEYKASAAPYAHIRMTVKLVDAMTHDIVATRLYDQVENVKADDLRHIIQAFDIAYQRVSAEIVTEMLHILRAREPQPAHAEKAK